MKRMILQTAAVDGPTTLIGIEESANGNAILQDCGGTQRQRDLTAGSPFSYTDSHK